MIDSSVIHGGVEASKTRPTRIGLLDHLESASSGGSCHCSPTTDEHCLVNRRMIVGVEPV